MFQVFHRRVVCQHTTGTTYFSFYIPKNNLPKTFFLFCTWCWHTWKKNTKKIESVTRFNTSSAHTRIYLSNTNSEAEENFQIKGLSHMKCHMNAAWIKGVVWLLGNVLRPGWASSSDGLKVNEPQLSLCPQQNFKRCDLEEGGGDSSGIQWRVIVKNDHKRVEK